VKYGMPPERDRRERSRPSSVSVIVPAYNAAATLAEQLEALAAQRYDGDWELVIVDNGSTDGTGDLARRYRQRFKAFTLVDGGSRRGHSAPRNAGASAARGELLAYCDADDVVAPGWLQAMADAARHHDLIGGWLDARPLNDDATRSWHQPWPRDRLRSWLLPYAVSANVAIWADVLRELGGWSSDYEDGGEDVELSWRAQLAGYRLGFAPDAVVQYRYRTGLRETARQAYGIGVRGEKILRDFAFLRAGDRPADGTLDGDQASDDGSGARRRALGRAAWLAARLPYLAGPRRHRGLWLSVGAEFAGRLSGAVRYRVLDRRGRLERPASVASASEEVAGRARAAGRPRILWLTRDATAPHPYLVEAARRAGASVTELHWAEPLAGDRSYGWFVELGARRSGREHPMSFKLVSPRLLARLVWADEDVIVLYELGLVGLYAGLSKLVRRRRRVVSLVEHDYRHLGRTGTAAFKVAFRRLAARTVDVFVANNEPARDYLIDTMNVRAENVVVGWWLAGLPSWLHGRLPDGVTPPDGTPLFVTAARLIPPKGIDLLIRAVATYRRRFGPCLLWVLGEGPERAALADLARRLRVEDAVVFVGMVGHDELKGALEAGRLLVLPTLRDLVGRVVVEALTVGVPVVVSPLTGAAGTVVLDGVNGIVADPRDSQALSEAMHRAADPAMQRSLREGVERTNGPLLPDAAAGVILRAVARARDAR
jgi:glycosyltransferase involved in cell wall biosynthesis/GT2 family glycosyltransferase